MAAIGGVAPGSIDFGHFYAKVCEALPFYARPLFIRVGSELEVTGEQLGYWRCYCMDPVFSSGSGCLPGSVSQIHSVAGTTTRLEMGSM